MTATKGPRSSRWVFIRRAGWVMVLLAGLVVALAEIGAASGGRAPSLPAAGNHGTPAVRTFAQALDEAQVRATTKARWVTIARNNTIVVLNSWDFRLIPILRQANPRVQVWVYKDL